MSGRRLVVVGDTLLDRDVVGTVERVCPEAPVPVLDETVTRSRPGGAGLAAALAASDGRDVTLVTALGDDAAGRELAQLLADAGVDVVDLGLDGTTPEKIRLRSGGQSLVRLDRGAAPAPIGPVPDGLVERLGDAAAVLVSDYGRGVTGLGPVRGALARHDRPVVWDPHPRGADPVSGCRLVTPNRSEVERRFPPAGPGMAELTACGRRAGAEWRAHGVAVTLGAHGALLVTAADAPLVVPAPDAHGGDTCGAGDRFASVAAARLADGALPSEAVVDAVAAASAFVAAGGAASAFRAPAPGGPAATSDGTVIDLRNGGSDPAELLAARVRAAGGTVVATGGCFDLLHAGHVSLLQSCRALGDCLIVCLNSDRSVGSLKGPGRPLVPEEDRAAVLRALGCVDAVAIFDEQTPAAILSRLRPHIFAKGGDYAGQVLPEEQVMAAWGGQVVVVPYLGGRSTTGLLRRAAGRAPAPSAIS